MTREFTVIPAVDIRGGRCVRLYQGQPGEETVFSEDPIGAAERWQSEGARFLHVVDLDGAFQGRPVNNDVIMEIAGRLSIPVEVGGGIRTAEAARSYIDGGVSRVVIGTAAFEDSGLLSKMAGELGERLVVGVDVKDGRVAVAGWTGTGGQGPLEAVEMLASAGVRRVIYTDTSKDGTLMGPNLDAIEQLARSCPVPLIASGGVGELEDIARVSSMGALGIEGIIVGMALYKRKFTLAEAQRAARERSAG